MEKNNEGPLLTPSLDTNPVQNPSAVVIEHEDHSHQDHPVPIPNTNNNDTQSVNILCEQMINISSSSDHLHEQNHLHTSNSDTVSNITTKEEGIQSLKPKQLFTLRGSPSQDIQTFKCPKIIQIPSKLRRPKTSTPTLVTHKMPILNAKGQIMPSEMGPFAQSSSKFLPPRHLPWEHSQPQKLLTTTPTRKNIPAKVSLSKIVEVSNRGKTQNLTITNNKKSDSELQSASTRQRQRPRSIQSIPLRSSSIINNSNMINNNNNNNNSNLNKSFSTRKPQNRQSSILIDSKQRQDSAVTKHNILITTSINKESAPKSRLLEEIKLQNLNHSPYNHSAVPNTMTQGMASSRPRSRQQREKDDKSVIQRISNSNRISYYNRCSNINVSNCVESSNLIRYNNNNNNKNRVNGKEISMKNNGFQPQQLFTKKITQHTETKLRNASNNNNNKAESKNLSIINPNKIIREKLIEKLMNSTNNIVEKPTISLPRIVSTPLLGNNNNYNKKVSMLKSTKNIEKQPETRRIDKAVAKNTMVKVRRKATESSKMNKVTILSEAELPNIEEPEKILSKELEVPEHQPPNIIKDSSITILTENVCEDKVHEMEINDKVKQISDPVYNNNEEINIITDNNNSNRTCLKDPETLKPLPYNKDDLPFPIPKELMKDQEFENEYEQDSSPINPRLNSPVSPTTSRHSKDPREKSLMLRLARQVDINDDITSDEDEDEDEEEAEIESGENESEFHSSNSSHCDGENIKKNPIEGVRKSSTHQKEGSNNVAHDFVSDYLQLESLREVNHVSQVICRSKICNAIKGADLNLTLEQLVLAKSRFLQLPCFSDTKFFTKIKVPPHICLRGNLGQPDKDLVTIQYLQTKMDDLYQKKLKNLEQKRNQKENSSSSSSSSSSSEKTTVHQNTSNSKNTFVVHPGNRKGVSLSNPESYVKSLERVLYSLQNPKWAKNGFALHSNEETLLNEDDDEDEEDDSPDQDSNSNTSEDEKVVLEQLKSNSPVEQGESSEERAALAKRILNMYTKGQKKIKLNSGGGDASFVNLSEESDKDADGNDKQEDEESESELHLP